MVTVCADDSSITEVSARIIYTGLNGARDDRISRRRDGMTAEASAQTDLHISHDLLLPYLHLLHPHHPRDINMLHEEQLTTGQRVADGVARTMGSWRFIIIQS